MEDILLLVASSSNFPRIRFQSVDFPHTFECFPNIRLSIGQFIWGALVLMCKRNLLDNKNCSCLLSLFRINCLPHHFQSLTMKALGYYLPLEECVHCIFNAHVLFTTLPSIFFHSLLCMCVCARAFV